MDIPELFKSSVVMSDTALCKGFILSYELLITKAVGGDNSDVYSILVVKTDSCNDYEYDFVYDVSRDYDTAKQYLNMLCCETVTPMSLRDILYDIM